MPNPRLLINLLKRAEKPLGKKVVKKIPYRKWLETDPLDPTLRKKVQFEGIQDNLQRLPSGEIKTKPGFYTFTDKKSGSTFLVPLEEDLNFGVWKKLKELEKSFGRKETKVAPTFDEFGELIHETKSISKIPQTFELRQTETGVELLLNRPIPGVFVRKITPSLSLKQLRELEKIQPKLDFATRYNQSLRKQRFSTFDEAATQLKKVQEDGFIIDHETIIKDASGKWRITQTSAYNPNPFGGKP